jgi:two-component system, cell cycle sensor histidine kinase and response regulator CckA
MEKKFSIAIIDDDAALASNLEDILKTEDYHVEAVNDGSAGIELFRKKTFDLALVDIKLPHMSGPELIKKLNRLQPETEYVLITAYASMDTAMGAVKQKQIIGYEKKPVNIDRLLPFIRQVVVRKRAEKALRQKTYELGERIKELNCLYSISNLVEKPDISLDEIIQGTVELIPPSWQYPEITCSRILLENKEFKTENFTETNWKQSSEIIVHGKRMGSLEICYLEEKPEIGEDPFLKEERNLINAVAERLGHIIERMWAEEAFRESEQKNKKILYHMSDYVWILDLNTLRVTFISAAVEKILGYNPDEIMALDLDKLFSPETMETVTGAIEKEVSIDGQDGVDRDRKNSMELEIIRKDGLKVWTEVSFSLLKDNEGRPTSFIGITRDITERKRIDAQLQQVTKMEAIATLAGGVAHEFNNTLMGIMGNIELLKMNFSEDEGLDKHLESMKSGGHRISRLTDQLLAYAEGGKYQPKNLKLDDFVIETLPILQHGRKSDIRVETHFPKDISHIKADHAQMQMVLSAILANSDEAIEDGGIIRITAENKNLDEDFTKQHPGLKPGAYACLTVEDDGKGMGEETRDGIFEPFFTTKFQGRGMGMAAVYGIVKNHDGWISVDSELGRGTTVRIYLPAIEVEIEKPKEAKAEVSTGSGTILMIEDEDVVIEVTQAMLEMLGYRVMVAKTGKDAIHIAETFDGQIDLALLDIKLPDIDGRHLYPLIMKARSNLKVIVFSGYSIDGPAREILDAGAQGFIQKPFSVSALSENLKKVFEGK